MSRRVFITAPHNLPTGGTKVLNEVVNLLNSKGLRAWLCLPEPECAAATFLDKPAPVLSLSYAAGLVGAEDIVICSWHSRQEINFVRRSPARTRIFWQHGVLIPVGADSVGLEVYKEGLFTDLWNVSHACAAFLEAKYKIKFAGVVAPFFTPTALDTGSGHGAEKRSGILVQERRGIELKRVVDAVALVYRKPVNVLRAPFRHPDLIKALRGNEFFMALDRGIRYQPPFRHRLSSGLRSGAEASVATLFQKPAAKWIEHRPQLLGFPMSSAEAAAQGCVVVGFAMGGGLEWMTPENSYIARDRSTLSLIATSSQAFSASAHQLDSVRNMARRDIGRFNPENTWNAIRSLARIDE